MLMLRMECQGSIQIRPRTIHILTETPNSVDGKQSPEFTAPTSYYYLIDIRK